MSIKHVYDYPMPALTSTAVIVCKREGKVLLVKRGNEPFKDMWCFPGGFFNQFESARDCCIREVKEETGIDISKECPNRPFNVISNKERDPRGWVVDCPFVINLPDTPVCKGQDDAVEAEWVDIRTVDGMFLAFDHADTWRYIRLLFVL